MPYTRQTVEAVRGTVSLPATTAVASSTALTCSLGATDTPYVLTGPVDGADAVVLSVTGAGIYSVTIGFVGAAAALPTNTMTDSATTFKIGIPAYGSVRFVATADGQRIGDMQVKLGATAAAGAFLAATFLNNV